MPMPAPTAAPPNFYDALPAGGDAAAGGPPPKKPGGEPDADEELMKGLTGVYRVLSKMAKLKKELKPGFDKMKEDIKAMVVQGLKKDPKDLDSGEDKPAEAPPEPPAGGPPSPPPSQTDESHAA
jgi:hypothetical protein